MGDVQDKSNAYAALDEKEVDDYLADLFAGVDTPEPQCDCARMNPYEKLMARKRKWTPVKPVAGLCREGAEETIHRALALRHMELPVGDFINDALTSEVPEAQNYSNQMYGTRRTTTWHSLTSPMLTALMKKQNAEAMALRDAWVSHQTTRYSKQWFAERAIFFVLLPFFRFNGDAGMRTVFSRYLTRDEQIHRYNQ